MHSYLLVVLNMNTKSNYTSYDSHHHAYSYYNSINEKTKTEGNSLEKVIINSDTASNYLVNNFRYLSQQEKIIKSRTTTQNNSVKSNLSNENSSLIIDRWMNSISSSANVNGQCEIINLPKVYQQLNQQFQ